MTRDLYNLSLFAKLVVLLRQILFNLAILRLLRRSCWLLCTLALLRPAILGFGDAVCYVFLCPRGLTFSWWGCKGLCHRHKLTKLAHSFFFILFLCLFLSYGPFNSISFHKFSRQLFAFPLCSSGLNSAFLVLSIIYLFIKVSLSPEIILCG